MEQQTKNCKPIYTENLYRKIFRLLFYIAAKEIRFPVSVASGLAKVYLLIAIFQKKYNVSNDLSILFL